VKNRQVQFLIQDVHFPEPAVVLEGLYAKTLVQGRVVELSEGGPDGEMFAVVEVEGLAQAVIVPVRCVRETS
jgi:hypothetical protein